MQRIVSGEGLPKYSDFFDRNKKETSSSPEIHAMLSHSPSTAFGHSANLVENDREVYKEEDGDVSMDLDNELTTRISESSMSGPRLESHEQPEETTYSYQRRSPTSPSFSVSHKGDGSNVGDKNKFTPTVQRQQQTPLSIISGMLPNVGLLPSSRNDSKNSSVGSFLQRSHNSSRDWGWFEDVHHPDQSVTGISSNRTGNKNNNSDRTLMAGSVASSGGTRKSQPQHRQTNTKASTTVHGSGVISSVNGNRGTCINGPNVRVTSNVEDKYYQCVIDKEGDRTNGSKSNNKSNKSVRGRGGTKSNAFSLLPTGDEMLIDETQEYLEPFLIHQTPRDMENAAVQAVTAPNYVLEESLSDQLLWKKTAGNRPPQPVEERAFFEAMWAENFAMSEVKYQMPAEVLTATTPVSLNPFADGNFGTDGAVVIGAGGTQVADVGGAHTGRGNDHNVADIVSSFVTPGVGHGVASGQNNPYLQNHHRVVRSSSGSGGNLTVYAKGDNVFGTTVSKSFPKPSINGELVSGVDTVNISIASYRVVESEKRGKHAQFLVIYREGSIRDTIGVWKRYSDFQELSSKVTKVHEGCASVIANMSPLAMTEEHDVEHLPNAITSWHLLKKRKRWYRCLDSGYLSLKAFLLERFLHDILFESSTPDLLRDFVGVPPPN